MTLKNLDKAPFPWFGGKSKAAPLVWRLLGDVDHYVEPFAGSLAVLLNRPHPCNIPYRSETVNDVDGFLVNFWRSVQFDPEGTAAAASWPVTEADKQARQIALLRWREAGGLERLMGDAMWHDSVMAGWWAWAVSVQIGAFAGGGAWTADPDTGVIFKQGRAHREPGVSGDLPHLSNDGRGVNRQGTREPGVLRSLPQLTVNGKGVNHAGTREPGVLDPHPDNPADLHQLDTVDWGAAYHDATMPELIRWFRHLCARLRHVRIINGDWRRVCTGGAINTLSVRMDGHAGIFLDPPYADTADRDDGLYAHDSTTVAHDVREWCLRHGDNPKWRIVLAGFEGEHGDALTDAGWTEHDWFTDGWLAGGMGNTGRTEGKSHQQHRERLWASPHCLTVNDDDNKQLDLFAS